MFFVRIFPFFFRIFRFNILTVRFFLPRFKVKLVLTCLPFFVRLRFATEWRRFVVRYLLKFRRLDFFLLFRIFFREYIRKL